MMTPADIEARAIAAALGDLPEGWVESNIWACEKGEETDPCCGEDSVIARRDLVDHDYLYNHQGAHAYCAAHRYLARDFICRPKRKK